MDRLNDALVMQRAAGDALYLHVPLGLAALIIVALAISWRTLHVPAIKLMQETLQELERERALRERLVLVASATTNPRSRHGRAVGDRVGSTKLS
jgi:hypothetical protein